jgi:hypothetical protein
MIITKDNIKFSPSGVKADWDFKLQIPSNTGKFGEVSIPLQMNYYDAFKRLQIPTVQTSLNNYLSSFFSNPTLPSDILCPEAPVPEVLLKDFNFRVSDDFRYGTHAVILMHAGRAGCISPLHFDWDHDYVLHVCVTGTKTFFLMPPEAGWLLTPVVNTSSICLPRLSESDQKAMLGKTGGYRIILNPGEAVLFPSMWWHAVQYTEPSAAFSIRFGGPDYLRPFAVLPRSAWLQRLVWLLFQSRPSNELYLKILTSCLEAFFAPTRNWKERYENCNYFYKEWLRYFKQEAGVKYLRGENFNQETALAGFELENLYTLPEKDADGLMPSAADIEEYLFAAVGDRSRLTRMLAVYAITKRQGLPVRRGLVPIVKENWP